MSVKKAVPVPEQTITSVDLTSWASGLFLNGAQNAPNSSFIFSKDVELTIDGFIIPRRVLTPFLPNTIETTYQKSPVIWQGQLYYFTADNNKVRFCKEGDTDWTNCGGSNTITTNNGGKPKFLRLDNVVFVLNGTNGDKLCYVDLNVSGFPVVKYLPVADPTVLPTVALTALTTGSFNIYTAYSFTTQTGETKISPITTTSVNIVRDEWSKNATSPSSIKITRPAGIPTNAAYWSVYISTAAQFGTIQDSDMLRVASRLDLNTVDFIDDGTLSIDLGAPAPKVNNTDGMRVDHGTIEDSSAILYGDRDNQQNIWISGSGPYAKEFTPANGGYRAEPELGTNFIPTAVIGFRNGQGAPSLTVLYSNTEGLSKQAVLEQQSVSYGNQSFSIWGITEQHYGAAGVAATDSAINYNGKLLFLSTDGFMQMNTQPVRVNVISTDPISIQAIDPYVRQIKNSAMKNVVGAGWDNKYHWTVPSAGFDTPQQILIQDDNNKVQDRSAWYALDIAANWVGVVSPQSDPAFVYISQGKSTYKLVPGSGTFDVKNGANVPFSTGATGPLIGMGGQAHNVWQADVQTMFYIMGLVGDITVGVTYRNQSGNLKTKTKTFHGPTFNPSGSGGWGDPEWTYSGFPALPGWSASPSFDTRTATAVSAVDVRIPIFIGEIFNEAQWFYTTPVGFGNYKIRAISFEGINLGVRPDLQ